eukprot:CAMPEP_0172881064 /NCGR_PEP_ID=MMETSP1075-20121228/116519_1 /TAXON_ID=2916 /ORGANISM="Ceratium fusus, Strain PA161109" /LENGTH=133 /DNA_ID=CAMNT_0013733415 /DNA_START=307 /DNA_END=708 /DNA_ORIENTATION=-
MADSVARTLPVLPLMFPRFIRNVMWISKVLLHLLGIVLAVAEEQVVRFPLQRQRPCNPFQEVSELHWALQGATRLRLSNATPPTTSGAESFHDFVGHGRFAAHDLKVVAVLFCTHNHAVICFQDHEGVVQRQA